ncbi:MAG TPA: hypothetical protein GX500_04500 [Firmicutes bacterium]|nr:hypothetical protein [Candidatus Fermentithermobacillaceae bacterium]
MNVSTSAEVWIASLVTIAIMSFVYKDNPFYRLVENLYVGVSAGHALVLGWGNIRDLALVPMVRDGKWVLVIPVILGLMLYTRYFKKLAWLSRIPLAVMMGIGTGLAISGTVGSQIVNQVRANLVKLNTIDNIIIVVGTFAVLAYFFFMAEHKGALGVLAGGGRYLMMVAFGAAFGSTVMGRMSLFIGRLQYLFGDWLGLIR